MQSKTYKNGEYANRVIATADKFFVSIVVYRGAVNTRIAMAVNDWAFVQKLLQNY